MYIVKVDYEEWEPDSYQGIYVEDVDEDEKEVVKRADSGDFVEDYNEIKEWAEENLGDHERLLTDSSLDHFLMDRQK